MELLNQPILVGVTGRSENTDALRFAAAEASHRGRRVTLVHALQPLLRPPPPSILMNEDSWDEVGHQIVQEVMEEFEAIAGPRQDVSAVVRHGSPGEVLPVLSKDATMVVLQHRDLSRAQRIFTGSTTASVAAHGHCPVVSVQSRPDGDRVDAPLGGVMVGVHEDGTPTAALEAAFREAEAHQCPLLVGHGWRLAPGYDEILARDKGWQQEVENRIHAAVAETSVRFPTVTVEVVIRHEYPADFLVDLSGSARLLVVGRHATRAPIPHRLGSLARAAIEHGRCAVMVVDN